MTRDLDRLLVLAALLAVLTAYTLLGWHGATDLTTPLRDVLLALAGCLAGISLPRNSGGSKQ